MDSWVQAAARLFELQNIPFNFVFVEKSSKFMLA